MKSEGHRGIEAGGERRQRTKENDDDSIITVSELHQHSNHIRGSEIWRPKMERKGKEDLGGVANGTVKVARRRREEKETEEQHVVASGTRCPQISIKV